MKISKYNEILKSVMGKRRNEYGFFWRNALIAQLLKSYFQKDRGYYKLGFSEKEAIHQIASKFSRLLTGDISHSDSWIDILGYAKLAFNSLKSKIEINGQKIEIEKQLSPLKQRGIDRDLENIFNESPNFLELKEPEKRYFYDFILILKEITLISDFENNSKKHISLWVLFLETILEYIDVRPFILKDRNGVFN